MPLGESKVQISIVIEKTLLAEVDAYAQRFQKSRSQMLCNFVESGVEDLAFIDRYFMKPESAVKIAVAVDSIASALGLPLPFKATDKEREFIDAVRKGRTKNQLSLLTE